MSNVPYGTLLADAPPVELRVLRGGAALRLTREHDVHDTLPASRIRAACRCAGCTAARAHGVFAADNENVRVVGVQLLGSYAVTFTFSDGHDRGIFPWRYLRQLLAEEATRP